MPTEKESNFGKEFEEICDEYYSLHESYSGKIYGKLTLDGSFSVEELRKIADLLEKYIKL